ncbi:MAG TPA: HAMP domain-containing sensor histidine kinase [Cyclobacteriaceae bacterium]|nr:HAMP domain-containing sensor histidine kinase [Cyclobacteriaceae bacterium]
MKGLKFLYGLNRYVLANTEYKRVLLTSQLSVIFVASLGVFSTLELLFGYYYPLPYNAIALLMGLLVIWLNRKGHFMAARIVLTLSIELITLFFTAVLPREFGIYIFSIAINIGILTVYGFERPWLTAGIILVSSSLFFYMAFYSPFRDTNIGLSLEYIEENLKISFGIASLAAVVIVYYLMRVNRQVENKLTAKDLSLQQRNQDLQTANTALDKFFYSVSHDLRAPLTSMQGLIQLMQLSSDVNELKQYAEMLQGRAENLDAFIRKIADYSKNSQLEVRKEDIVLRRLLRENLENLRFYPNAASIRVVLDIPDTVRIQSDSFRLQEVFGNLISNAFKYHDPSKASFVRITTTEDDDLVSVIIEDNGLGMREEELPRIFEMFYRANRDAQGTGLGLYIVQETLLKLQGKIEVESTYGKGSVFRVHLPKKAA